MRVKSLVALCLLVACGDPTGPSVNSVVLSTGTFSVSVGGTKQLGVTLRDAENNLTGTTAEWSSSNPALATVDQTGKVTGVAVGTVQITASAGGKSSTANATVTSMPTGPWQGTLINAALTMTLSETGGVISGTGNIIFGGTQALPLTYTGTYTAPNITITATPAGFQPFTITAVVSLTSMVGKINGSGFVNESLTLTKQPAAPNQQ
jgi:hypothetical protein